MKGSDTKININKLKISEKTNEKIIDSKEQEQEKETEKDFDYDKKRERERSIKLKLKKRKTFYNNTELIIFPILNKIINIAVHQSCCGISRINDYCFNFLKNQLNPLLQEEHLNFTKNKFNNIPTWSNSIQKESLCIEIPEPSTINYDRFENTFINFKTFSPKTQKSKKNTSRTNKSKKSTNKQNVKFQKNTNSNKNLPDLIDNLRNKSRRNTSSRQNTNNSKISIMAVENNKKNNNQLNKNEKIETQKNEKDGKNILNFSSSTPKKRTRPSFDYPSFDIPNFSQNPIEENLEEVNLLRKERKELEIQKEIEEKIRQEKLKKMKPIEIFERNIKSNKIIDSNKLTFDSDGNIVKIKHIKLSNFKKDFILSKFGLKNENKPKNIIKKKKNNSEKEKNSELPEKPDTSQIEVIKNPGKENDNKKEKEKETIKSITNKEKIIPSGSNFDLLTPNYGVIIKENDKKKEGSKEFNKYFNKYSLKDYDRMLKEYLPLQNKFLLSNKMKENLNTKSQLNKYIKTEAKDVTFNNTDNNKSPLNTEYNFNFSEITNNNNMNMNQNSIFSSTNINENENFKTPQKKSFYHQPLYTAYNYNLKVSKIGKLNERYKTFSFENSITVKNGNGSVKLELDALNDLDQNKYKSNIKNNTNIFRKNKRNERVKIPENKLLSEFNKNILTSTDWGAEKSTKENNQKTLNSFYSLSKHQSKYQALRELGSNILNGIKVKYPRNRKVDLNI